MNEEEKQELETLRAEKLRREQVERARAALERGGVPQSFAAYQASLAEDVKSRLPASAPVVTAPLPQRPRRGIRRLR